MVRCGHPPAKATKLRQAKRILRRSLDLSQQFEGRACSRKEFNGCFHYCDISSPKLGGHASFTHSGEVCKEIHQRPIFVIQRFFAISGRIFWKQAQGYSSELSPFEFNAKSVI